MTDRTKIIEWAIDDARFFIDYYARKGRGKQVSYWRRELKRQTKLIAEASE